MRNVNIRVVKKEENVARIRRLRDKYRIIMKNLYRENKQFKIIITTSHEEKLINFDAKKHYIKVRLRYNNVFLINLLKESN